MQATPRLYFTEFLGTFLLVLFGAGTICAYATPNAPRLEVTGIALAEGFILGVLLCTFGPLGSAGFNPAITLALYICQILDLRATVQLVAVQIAGAILAGLLLYGIFHPGVALEAHLGRPYLKAFLDPDSPRVTMAALTSGALVEMLFTAVLTLAFCWWMLDPKAPRMSGILVGLVQTAIILFGFHLTGGAANPARWLGPTVWEGVLVSGTGVYADHAVYWAGPIAGAILGAVVAGMLRPQTEGRK